MSEFENGMPSFMEQPFGRCDRVGAIRLDNFLGEIPGARLPYPIAEADVAQAVELVPALRAEASRSPSAEHSAAGSAFGGVLPLVSYSENAVEHGGLAAQTPWGEVTPAPKRRRLSTKSPAWVPAGPAATPPRAPLTDAQQEELEQWKAVDRLNLKRAKWVTAWIFLCSSALQNVAYVVKKTRAVAVWRSCSDDEREEIYEKALAAGWLRQRLGAPKGNQNARKPPAAVLTLSGMGFLLTWHAKPVVEDPLRELLLRLQRVSVEDMEYEVLMAQLREDQATQAAWAGFQHFLVEVLPRAGEIKEVTSCMEVCLNGADARFHFHAMVSNVKPEVGRDAMPVTLKMGKLKYGGFLPYPQISKGRGRQVQTSVDRGHCYCQLEKPGPCFRGRTILAGPRLCAKLIGLCRCGSSGS